MDTSIMSHAPLTGIPLEEDAIASLNRRLAANSTIPAIQVVSVSTKVTGTNADNARLMVEGIISGREWTPFLLETPLGGSKAEELNDKNFVDILFGTPGKIVKDFFRELADKTPFIEGNHSNNGVIIHKVPEEQTLFTTR